MRIFILATSILVVAAAASHSGPQYVNSPPLAEVIQVQVGEFKKADEIEVPVITWGGDIATIVGNGNSLVTAKGSLFDRSNLKMKLVRQDDFKKQVESYIKGESPYLRGTLGMINMAAEVLSRDPRTQPVIVYQMTWSAGGDCLVVKEGIKTVKDLRGKTVALQAYGPHVDYLGTVMKDAGLSVKDLRIVWTRDLTGTENTPAEAFVQKDVDAAFVIIPDGLMLTSKGKTGTGAEGSVKGAKILMSTKTANRIIADVYAVRRDYFQAHKDGVQAFVHGLLLAEQQLAGLFKEKKRRVDEFKKMITTAAKILLDSEQAVADAEALFGDCEYVGYAGNVRFFGDLNWPRNMTNLTQQIQSTLITIGLMRRNIALTHAQWDYNQLRAGLAGIENVQVPRFKPEEVARVIEKKRAGGTLGEGELFSFEIYFQPNQNTFPAEMYKDEFDRVVELASTYGGAIIIVEGHSDPMGYLRQKKGNAEEIVLKRIKQAARNLSLTRATAVRDNVMTYAQSKGVSLDPSQFTVVGHGIAQPKTGMCGADPCAPETKEEWQSNMRVAFRIMQVEAEETVFTPLE
jgi:outer membrane protein OmpA-like peptidoglycan-associated protein/ABC-type nitrate/sulfonate/bicarbonate transport system substrate-binding protein